MKKLVVNWELRVKNFWLQNMEDKTTSINYIGEFFGDCFDNIDDLHPIVRDWVLKNDPKKDELIVNDIIAKSVEKWMNENNIYPINIVDNDELYVILKKFDESNMKYIGIINYNPETWLLLKYNCNGIECDHNVVTASAWDKEKKSVVEYISLKQSHFETLLYLSNCNFQNLDKYNQDIEEGYGDTTKNKKD